MKIAEHCNSPPRFVVHSNGTIENVEYRDILGFPGYAVGDNGWVWTCIKNGKTGQKGRFVESWRRASGGPCGSQGHWHVRLRRDNRDNYRYVHRLVLEAFVGPCPEGMECRHHPDPSPANNRLTNLSWGSHLENMRDRARHGTICRGSRSPRAKLNETLIPEIRRMKSGGFSLGSIARRFNVSHETVRSIVTGKSWKHVSPSL